MRPRNTWKSYKVRYLDVICCLLWGIHLTSNDLIDSPEQLSTMELKGLRKLANYLSSETMFLDSKNPTADKRRQVRQDIPSTITAPIELVTQLGDSVSKVLGDRIEVEPSKGSGSSSLKVKLKVQPSVSSKPRRLKLKMKDPPIQRGMKKEDDDFVYDDNQFFDEEIDDASLAVEDDDDDYVQGDEGARRRPKRTRSIATTEPIKRKRNEKKSYKDDSSDDGLGTSKVTTKRVSHKGIEQASSDKKIKGSVKQRLLNRIKKK